MNVHPTIQRTPAETALIEAFNERVSLLPGDGSVAMRRDDAVETLKAGLPTRRVEAWHYTDLRRLLTSVPPHDETLKAEPVAPLLEGSSVLPILNGIAAAAVPDVSGVTVQRVSEKLGDGSFARALELQGLDDAVGALNSAFAADGWFLDIPERTTVEVPIELQNVQAGGQVHVRLPVRVGAGAKATIVERQTGDGAALVSSVGNLLVGDDAEVLYLIVQEHAGSTTHLAQFNAQLGRNSKLTLFVMNAGGKLVRQEVRVSAAGEGSSFRLRGVNLLAGDTHTDVTMMLDHAAPHTDSTEVIRNVVTGRARGVFQGQIKVAKGAQKTDAKMACNTLLLSDEGEFSTKPELEIFADDVACGHGATMTEIDRNHLFYLMARGIDEKSARGLLVRAFLAEVIEELEDEAVVDALEEKLAAWFATHG